MGEKLGEMKASRLPLLWLLPVVLLPWGAAFYFGPAYEINDDVANVILFRGVFGAGSVDSSIFVSALFSHGLSLLYRVNEAVPWYPLLVLATLGVAHLLLAHMVWRSAAPPLLRACLLVVVSFFVFKLALNCSFTASALMLSGVALFYGQFGPGADHPRWRCLALVFLAIGYLLRPGIFPLAVVAWLPALVITLVNGAGSVRKGLQYGLLVAVVIGALYSLDAAVESSATAAFRQDNLARAKFSDSSWGAMTRDFKRALFAAGWTPADYVVARNLWWYVDDTVHSIDAFKAFTEANQAGQAAFWSLSELKYHLGAVKYAGLLLALLLAGWLVLEQGWRQPWVWLAIGLSLLCIAVLAGVRFPPRVAYPFFSLIALSAIAGIGRPEPVAGRWHWPKLLWLPLLLAPLVWAVVTDAKTYRAERDNGEALYQAVASAMDETQRETPEALFVPVMFRGFSEASFVRPFAWQPLHRSLPYGWMAQSPLRKPYLDRLGFDPKQGLMPQLLARKNTVWYCLASNSEARGMILDPLMSYLNGHYRDETGGAYVPRIRKIKAVGSAVWLFFEIERESKGA